MPGQTSYKDFASEQDDERDVTAAVAIIKETLRASTSSIQRRLRIGYTRAARVMDILEERGIVGPVRGSESREILVDLGDPGAIPTITINTDRKCKRCGYDGVCENGLCLACNTDRIKRMPAGLVRDVVNLSERMGAMAKAKSGGDSEKAVPVSIQDKAFEAAVVQLRAVLLDNWPRIWTDMKEALEIHEEEQSGESKPKAFVFGVGAKVVLAQVGSDWAVESDISWSVRHKDGTNPVLVSDQPTLFEHAEGKGKVGP